VFAEYELPPPHLMPAPELMADGVIDADGLKAQSFPQADTAGGRDGDTGIALEKSCTASSASPIWLRAALCVQTKRTRGLMSAIATGS
jgi:hypothetical protein